MLARSLYFLRKALGSIGASPGLSILTAGTIAVSLVVLGAFAMALQNLENLALVWGRSATLTAYLQDELTEERWESIRQQIAGFDSVRAATLVTPHQALERFRARGPQAAALVEGVTEAILPAQIDVQLRAGFADLTLVEAVSREVAAVVGVSEVDYGQEEFERLQALLSVLRTGGALSGLLLALATSLIVANTIRLTVFARRDEIAIQRLVGATGWFIRLPFLIEGTLWGAAGGALGAGLLLLADATVAVRISEAIADVLGGLEVRLVSTPVAMALVLGGMALGAGGSLVAMRRLSDEGVG